MSGLKRLSRVFGRRQPEAMNYRTAKQLARNGNPEVRRDLATRDDVRPEILYFLADDPAVGVRRAKFPAAPWPRSSSRGSMKSSPWCGASSCAAA